MEKIRNAYAHFIIFICILIEFGYTIVVANYLSGTLRSVLLIVVSLPLLFLFRSRSSKYSIILLLYSILIIMLNILRDNAIGDNILLTLPLLVGYLIATRLPLALCITAYCNVVLFLAIYSLATYVLCFAIPGIAGGLPYIGGFQDTAATMHNALFSVIISGAQFPRNFGITWEPGAFAILLIIAIFCTVFCYEKINKTRIIVLCLCIITTFSTMGYIVLAMLFITFLGFRKNKSNNALIIIATLIIIITLQIPFMHELTFGKLEGLTNSTGNISETTEARINAILYPGMAFVEHPIFGVGYSKFKQINEILCNNVATNSIINWFAIFGILLGIPFTFCYLFSIKRLLKEMNWLFVSVILLAAIFVVSTESLLRISLIYTIIFIGTLNASDIKTINNG